jgi:hypothetical protein
MMMVRKFIERASPKELIAIIILSSLSAILPVIPLFVFLRKGNQVYRDIVVGDIIAADQCKTGDYFLFIGYFIFFVIFFFGILSCFQSAPFRRFLYSALRTFRQFLSYGITLIRYRARNISYAQFIVDILLVNVFGFFSVYAIFCIIGLFFKSGSLWNTSLPKNFLFFTIGAINTAILLSLWFIKRKEKNAGFLKRLVFLSQLLIPFVLIRLLFVTVAGSAGKITYSVSLRAALLIWAIIVGSFIFNLLKITSLAGFLRSRANKKIFFTTALSIGSLICAWQASIRSIIPGDYFHTGEFLNTYHQLVQLSQRYYLDYIPIHGLQGVFHGAINAFAYNGKAVTLGFAMTLGEVFFSMLAVTIAYFTMGEYIAILVALSFPHPASTRLYMVPCITLMLLSHSLIKRPPIWLVAYALLSVVHIMWAVPVGAALTVAFFPIAVSQMLKFIREHEVSKPVLYVFFMAVFLGSIIFYFKPLQGLIQYAVHQGKDYAVAGGALSLWHRSFRYILFQILRLGAGICSVIILFAIFIFGFLKSRIPDQKSQKPFLTHRVALIGILFFLVLVPYSMGRIDAFGLSRVGNISLLLLYFFVPVAASTLNRVSNNKGFVFFFAALLCANIFYINLFEDKLLKIQFSNLQSRDFYLPFREVEVSARYRLIDGGAEKLANLGEGYVPINRFEELKCLRGVIAKFVSPNEIFYNFTDSSALYFLLNRKIPVPYDACYYAMNYETQQKVIEKLKDVKPSLVLIGMPGSDIIKPVSLRSYRVYKHILLEGYSYYEEKGLKFLVKKDKFADALDGEEKNRELARVFATSDLMMIPNAWGRNFNNLRRRFRKYPIRFLENYPSVFIFDHPVKGSEADFVFIKLKKPIAGRRGFRISWSDERNGFGTIGAMDYSLNQTNILIPLGADPRWLLNNKLTGIRLSMLNEDKENNIEVEEVQLLSLIR